MNFSKKIHEPIGKNRQLVKKIQKHDANLQKNSTLYFQVGLILTLQFIYKFISEMLSNPGLASKQSIKVSFKIDFRGEVSLL